MDEDNQEDIIKAQKEKELKEISERLAKFKSDKQGPEKETLAFKMPSRSEDEEETPYKRIEIPVSKRLREQIEADSGLHDKSEFMEDTLSSSSGHKNAPPDEKIKETPIEQDDSLFGGKLGVSRRILRKKMIIDSEIKKAARMTKLGLTPSQRVNLVKEVFSPRLGTNISEKDLSKGIKKLNRQLRSTESSSKEHRLIRKEIKFFKRISGK
jgi:hypothetical protein